MDKLKECPFCGGEANCESLGEYYDNEQNECENFVVACSVCNAVFPPESSREACLDKWNNRTTPTTPAGQVEAVAEYDMGKMVGFLLGESTIGGVGYGDKPEGETRPFWWRKYLRAAYDEQKGREIYLQGKASGAEHIAGWQPIETAPMDGTAILACNVGCRPFVCFWSHIHSCGWISAIGYDSEGVSFTHWMPLPLPPELRGK